MTQEQSTSRIAEARYLAGKLEEATERLNETLKRAEKAIVDMGINVYAEVEMLPPEDAQRGISMRLAYERHEGRWRLVIVTGMGATSLLKASRHSRIEAAKHMDQLIEAIIREAEQWGADLAEAERVATRAIALAESGADSTSPIPGDDKRG